MTRTEITKKWREANPRDVLWSDVKIVGQFIFLNQHWWNVETRFGIGTVNAHSRRVVCMPSGECINIIDDVSETIKGEELRFFDLLKRNEALIGKRISGEEAFKLYTERGLPPELFEVSDMDTFRWLFESHRLKAA